MTSYSNCIKRILTQWYLKHQKNIYKYIWHNTLNIKPFFQKFGTSPFLYLVKNNKSLTRVQTDRENYFCEEDF